MSEFTTIQAVITPAELSKFIRRYKCITDYRIVELMPERELSDSEWWDKYKDSPFNFKLNLSISCTSNGGRPFSADELENLMKGRKT